MASLSHGPHPCLCGFPHIANWYRIPLPLPLRECILCLSSIGVGSFVKENLKGLMQTEHGCTKAGHNGHPGVGPPVANQRNTKRIRVASDQSELGTLIVNVDHDL